MSDKNRFPLCFAQQGHFCSCVFGRCISVLSGAGLSAAVSIFVGLLFAACSTTSHLPEDEQLYVGIEKIDYTETPVKKVKIRRDSVGVITTFSDVAKAVDNALSGKADDGLIGKLREDAKGVLTPKEERTAEKKAAEVENATTKAALETAQTEVEAVLSYPPNNALFGSSYHRSPLQLGLWFYNGYVDAQSKFGKWVFRTFAENPVFITSVSPETRAKVAQNTLHNYGFFNGRVTHEVITQKDPKKAKIRYNVAVGPVSLLDSVEYLPYFGRQNELLASTYKARNLKRGDAFSVVSLAAEQTRIGELFRENGYYFWQDAFTTYQADTLQKKNYVQLRVQPKNNISQQALHPWYIGNINIALRRHEKEQLDNTPDLRRSMLTDSIRAERRRRNSNQGAVAGRTRRNTINYLYGGKTAPLRRNVWSRAITHTKGDLYKYSDQKSTLEKINTLGVFSQMDISYVPKDTAASCDTLDIYISAMLDKPYDSDFEMNATLKSNQQIGPGFSYTLNKRNAFRGGETVSFKLFGSYEWQLRSGSNKASGMDSYELGSQIAFTFPRVYAPFIYRRRQSFPAETTFAFDFDWKRRANFFTMINSGLSVTYNWHKKDNILHEFTPLGIDFVRTINTTEAYDSILMENPALYVSMNDQFIPSMSYTFTYTSPSRHRNPLMLQIHAKEAGNLVSGIYSLSGKGFNDKGKTLLGSPFAQFLKLTGEVHYSIPWTRDLTIATRFFGGVIWSYGNSTYAPYSEQFYVGGANSVRGFAVRSIGPGGFKVDYSKYSYILQTGDVKLEANVELRAHLFGSLYGAVFLDAGNVWEIHKSSSFSEGLLTLNNLKKIAVGTGAGIRYDLEFIVLRLDLGVGLHAPYHTGKSGFFNLRKFSDALNLHFAIGYPF